MEKFVKKYMTVTKFLVSIFLSLWFVWQVNAQNLQDVPHKTLVIAIDENYLPQSFLNIEGQPSGLFIDIWRLWAQKTGTDITFLTSNWNDTLTNLKTGKADIHSGLFYSDSRAEWIVFSKPFYAVGTYFFSLVESDKIYPHQDLAGKKIGALLGSFQEEYVRQKYPKAEVIAFKNREDMIRAVFNKKIDALIGEGPAIQTLINRFGLTGYFSAGDILFTRSFQAGVLKENTSLLSLLNKGFEAISEKELAEIEKRWIFDPYRQYFKSELTYVLDAIPAMVWIARDPECRVIVGNRYVNETFNVAANTNVSQTAARDGKAVKIVHLSPDGRELQPEELPMQLSIARREPVMNMEFTYLLPDGRRINAISNAVPLFDEYGEVRGSVCAVLDITETKNAAARLQNRTRMFLMASVGFIVILGIMLLVVARMWHITKQNADTIRESEALLRTAGHTACFGGWSATPDGKKIVWSEQVAIIHEKPAGYSPTLEETIGYYAPEWREKIKTVFEKCAREGKRYDEEMEIITNSGRRRWVRTTGEAIRDKSGEIVRVCGSFQDITERKQMEENIKSQARLLDLIFEHSLDSIVLLDKDYNFIRVSESYAKICRKKSSEFPGHNHFEFYPSSLQDEFEHTVRKKMIYKQTNRPFIFPDYPELGVTYWDLSCVPIVDQQGEIELFILTLKDVTDRKRSEDALRISEQRFRSLFEGSRDGFVIVNLSGKIIDANSAFCTMLGYTLDELRAMNDFYQITPEKWREWEAVEVWEKRLLTRGYSGLYEKEYIRKDGTYFPVELNSFTVKNQAGEIDYLWSVVRDITDRKRAEEALRVLEAENRRAQKLESIGLLAGGIAHDFNNMLSIISGNISYALSKLKPDDELLEVLNDVQTGTKQAQKLTQQLLTFAKGGAPIKKQADLRELLKESALFITRGSKVRCEFIFPDDLWLADVDTGQMNQAISNIIINAVQAMPDGGTIQIKAENQTVESENSMLLPAGTYVKIIIKDNGIGISEKHISKIFDPFFTTKQKGRGLGLATTYSIIKGHNGYISVESKLGIGTTFFIYLPAKKVQPVIEPPKPSMCFKGQGKVLIMDDEEMIRSMYERLFNLLGYKTSCAEDGHQAVQMYQEAMKCHQPFDLVILDLTIPGGMGGVETISELLKIDPKVKAIVASGYSNDPIMANYKDYGFCGAMPKPIRKSEIEEVLSKVLSRDSS